MKAWEILGYAFDGDIYCVEHTPQPKECDCGETDENGICPNNCHGYGPNPIFASDAQGDERCGECGEAL